MYRLDDPEEQKLHARPSKEGVTLGEEWLGDYQADDFERKNPRLPVEKMHHVLGTFSGNLAPMPLGERYEVTFGIGWRFPVVLPNPTK